MLVVKVRMHIYYILYGIAQEFLKRFPKDNVMCLRWVLAHGNRLELLLF